jgi:hypothetical protein
MAASSSPLSASSYTEAQSLMRANPGRNVVWSSGEGWTSTGYYDKKLRRCVVTSASDKGGFC